MKSDWVATRSDESGSLFFGRVMFRIRITNRRSTIDNRQSTIDTRRIGEPDLSVHYGCGPGMNERAPWIRHLFITQYVLSIFSSRADTVDTLDTAGKSKSISRPFFKLFATWYLILSMPESNIVEEGTGGWRLEEAGGWRLEAGGVRVSQ